MNKQLWLFSAPNGQLVERQLLRNLEFDNNFWQFAILKFNCSKTYYLTFFSNSRNSNIVIQWVDRHFVYFDIFAICNDELVSSQCLFAKNKLGLFWPHSTVMHNIFLAVRKEMQLLIWLKFAIKKCWLSASCCTISVTE